jgi:hypothetical protein
VSGVFQLADQPAINFIVLGHRILLIGFGSVDLPGVAPLRGRRGHTAQAAGGDFERFEIHSELSACERDHESPRDSIKTRKAECFIG